MRVWLLTLIALAACGGDETLYTYGAAKTNWALTEINGAPFQARATIRFDEGGAISGTAPCNSYAGKQTQPYPWFGIGAISATKRACADLAAETAYFQALQRMSLSEVGNATLILSNDRGESLVFTAQ